MKLLLQHRNYRSNKATAEGLRNALDRTYARLRQLAREEWQRGFSHADPSDACVSVRIAGHPKASLAFEQ